LGRTRANQSLSPRRRKGGRSAAGTP
jgi:hypothetical protein